MWARSENRVTNPAQVAAGMGKQVVVTVAAAIAVEDKDAHDIMDQTEMEITDLIKYMTLEGKFETWIEWAIWL